MESSNYYNSGDNMKKFGLMLMLVLSTSAFADQCQLVSSTMAKRAALLLQNGSEIASLCQPCGEVIASAQVSVARSVKSVSGNYGNLQEVKINGKGVDLAYTYVKVAPNKFVNVAKTIGCKAEGVSEVISK
jgi:hypothetical protein